jgi:hypothetical protein
MRLLKPAIAAAVTALVAAAPASTACVKVGVYQDNPVRSIASLQKAVGPGTDVISTYLTAGRLIDPRLIQLANARKASLMVAWLPDSGADGAKQPKYKLALVAKGKYDASLKALAKQLKAAKREVVFRPMPEANTPWYAWSVLANGNTAAQYVTAWKHIRKVMRKAGARNVKFLWAPYARSIPDTGPNSFSQFFPGVSQVDYVGASAYNFGTKGGLAWTDAVGLFSTTYSTLTALAPKPFWIAETGSTATGGDKAAWITQLATLRTTMPKLAGVVWHDARDGNGDFRLAGKPVVKAFQSLLRKSCR